jgi:hypothetical protein
MTENINTKYQGFVDDITAWMNRAQEGKSSADRTNKEVKRLLLEMKTMIGSFEK